MQVTVAGFRWEVELVAAYEAEAGWVVSLAGRHVREALTGERPTRPVDWAEEFSRAVQTREPEHSADFVRFEDRFRTFVAGPTWPVLRWRLLG